MRFCCFYLGHVKDLDFFIILEEYHVAALDLLPQVYDDAPWRTRRFDLSADHANRFSDANFSSLLSVAVV
jgi:hypothetical protein